MSEVKTLSCSFPRSHEPDEQGIVHGNFELEIIVDTIAGTAFIVGNGGVAELLMYSGSDGISFLEVLPSGAVQVTTLDRYRNACPSSELLEPMR